MKIVLNESQWEELNVKEEELFVRSAFFLSFSYMHIQARCRGSSHERERISTVKTAIELGMSADDILIKGTKHANCMRSRTKSGSED